ncbi:hypothetical protein Ple7327_3220 [Pleurocapsa sp. PCC 7327]|uniref:hypothetical protein n=1 Tax=Pleurocapsa sp. PCC 7327 TaxID=118163 RepID=UPI0002A0008F|nr:hypothetical protein [Pleurocapsa sp. PCC 7327]AFY78446.1 hypothetical protein Ple7327_3220 [Pleurocapsa sp. PCC 7327]
MLTKNRLQDSAKVAIALLTFGIAIGSSPGFASTPITQPKPLVVPLGTAQDLQGTQAKTPTEWLEDVGGEYGDEARASQPTFENQTSNFAQRYKTVNQYWKNIEQNVQSPEDPISSFRVPLPF